MAAPQAVTVLYRRDKALAATAAVVCLLAAAYALYESYFQAAVLQAVAGLLGGFTVATLNNKP